MDFGLVGTITRKITELPESISCIDTGLIRPQLAACYLVAEADAACLIETGTGYSVADILAVLAYKGIPAEHIHFIMPTHVHLDHAGGAGHLMQKFPNARLVIHPRGARHMIDPARLWQGALDVYGEEVMHRLYGELVPVEESRIIIAEDNFELYLNNRRLLFIDTPGHARHHYSIYDEQSRGFFTGDTFGMAYKELTTTHGPYIMPTTTPVQFDPVAWYKTLERYLTFKPARMYLTHFGMVENVDTLADDLKRRLGQYEKIALEYAESNDRIALIKAKIIATTLAELRELDCPLPIPALTALLKNDMELNALGLDVWLRQTAGN